MTTTLVRYEGVNQRGRSIGGATKTEDIADFIEGRFEAGWKNLTVHLGSKVVGGIGPHPDTQKRTWWTE